MEENRDKRAHMQRGKLHDSWAEFSELVCVCVCSSVQTHALFMMWNFGENMTTDDIQLQKGGLCASICC